MLVYTVFRKEAIIIKDRIKILRKKLGFTQQIFADRIGIARGNVAAYEVGKNAPSDAVIQLICSKFNVSEEWLRTGEGDMFIELDPEDELMIWAGTVLKDKPESFRRRFVRMLSKMTDEEWGWVESKLLELYEGIEKATDE